MTIELTYDAYRSNLRILIDSKPISPYSSLLQYASEPMYVWCDKIMDAIYIEVQTAFRLVYISRSEDAEVMRWQYEHSPAHMRVDDGFVWRAPVYALPLDKRMSEFGALLKQHDAWRHAQTVLAVDIYVASSVKSWAPALTDMEIANQYCRIDPHVRVFSEPSFSVERNSICFLVASDLASAKRFAPSFSQAKYTFVFVPDDAQRLIEIDRRTYFMGFAKDDLMSAVFFCMLLYPLLELFIRCTEAVRDAALPKAVKGQLALLQTISYIDSIEMPQRIELQTSAELRVVSMPNRLTPPQLEVVFAPPGVVDYAQGRLIAKSVGSTTVTVRMMGELLDLHTQTLTVYKRRRITSLTLSEMSMTLCEGSAETLRIDYVPEDADNIDAIRWKSCDERVARVSQHGTVQAISAGKTTVYCVCEGVQADCQIHVKPKIQDIAVTPAISDEPIEMAIGETMGISAEAVPANAFTAQISITSSNMFVVNVVAGMLCALSAGSARIRICDSGKNVDKGFSVVVKPAKTSWFEKLLNWLSHKMK